MSSSSDATHKRVSGPRLTIRELEHSAVTIVVSADTCPSRYFRCSGRYRGRSISIRVMYDMRMVSERAVALRGEIGTQRAE